MKKHTFIADGKTRDFYFTGKFFLKGDIVVLLNGVAATDYNLICTAGGGDSDIPYIGGQVHFYKPPRAADVITISRNLPPRRIADYQPTARYNPVTLNRDLNYLMEIINDIRAGLNDVCEKYTDITDADLLKNVSARMDMIITTIEEKISHIDNIADDIGRIPELGANLDHLAQAIGELASRVDVNGTEIERLAQIWDNMTDYVIDSQEPTAGNNYTWYRRYASGWVEQGSRTTNTAAIQSVTLPIEMANTSYAAYLTRLVSGTADDIASISQQVRNLSTTSFQVRSTYATAGAGGVGGGNAYLFNWVVYGMSKPQK